MSFTRPLNDRYFEDYVEGSVTRFGGVEMTQSEIIAFAKKYDPQVFHVDPEGARRTHFGGLVASGWHTVGTMTRLLRQHYLNDASSMGSPGIDELRWLKPVRPGDILSAQVTVLKSVASRSKPDRGAVTAHVEVFNQNAEKVLSLKIVSLIARRPVATPGAAAPR